MEFGSPSCISSIDFSDDGMSPRVRVAVECLHSEMEEYIGELKHRAESARGANGRLRRQVLEQASTIEHLQSANEGLQQLARALRKERDDAFRHLERLQRHNDRLKRFCKRTQRVSDEHLAGFTRSAESNDLLQDSASSAGSARDCNEVFSRRKTEESATAGVRPEQTEDFSRADWVLVNLALEHHQPRPRCSGYPDVTGDEAVDPPIGHRLLQAWWAGL